MRRLLLDTPVLLWWLTDDKRLGSSAKTAIGDARNQVYVSAATVWEIAQHMTMGIVTGLADVQSMLEEEGFESLPFDCHHGELAGSLSPYTMQFTQMMMIAQTQAEGLTLVTAEKRFKQFGIRTLDAST